MGNFRGLSWPFKNIGNHCCCGRCSVASAFAAKGIIHSPITSCSRRDHSVCQTSANSILKHSGRRRCGLSAAKGGDGIAQRGRSLISTVAMLRQCNRVANLDTSAAPHQMRNVCINFDWSASPLAVQNPTCDGAKLFTRRRRQGDSIALARKTCVLHSACKNLHQGVDIPRAG